VTGPDEHQQEQSPEEPTAAAATPATQTRSDPPQTDEPTVDAAIERLRALDELPVAEHVGVFDEAHRQLQDSLADLDEE
jgi:hypothetical protein